jgi:putative membrane protein
MKLKDKFNEQDLQRIKHAVKEAEDQISGEIVPVIVQRSGTYTIAVYKAALVFAALGFVFMIILDRYIISDPSNTLYYDPVFIFFVVLSSGLLGVLLAIISEPFKRLFISRRHFEESTRIGAEAAFLEEEVFNTRHRTGIMIFISFFEHKVIVMADRGISKVVEQREWDSLVSSLIGGIRAGKAVEGLEAAIKRCGAILLEKGFHKTADDINELRDDLRIN